MECYKAMKLSNIDEYHIHNVEQNKQETKEVNNA